MIRSWTGVSGEKRKKSDAEKRFERGRWAWFATAGIAMVGYLLASGVVRIEFGGDEVEEEEEEEFEEDEILVLADEEDDDED